MEKQNHTIGKIFDKYELQCELENKEYHWSDNFFLAEVSSTYNNSYHASIGGCPYESFFGRKKNITTLTSRFQISYDDETGEVVDSDLDLAVNYPPTVGDINEKREFFKRRTEDKLTITRKRYFLF